MNIIDCTSCGSKNTLPLGKNSMFCSYCGTPIERKVEQHELVSSILSKPYITAENGKLSLTNKGIKSIKEVINWFTDEELKTIERLDLSNNQITDVSGLEKLICLSEINLSGNPFTELSSFPKLINVGVVSWKSVTLKLDDTNIKSISKEAIEAIKDSFKDKGELIHVNIEDASSLWVADLVNELIEFNEFKGTINFYTNDDLTNLNWRDCLLTDKVGYISSYTYSASAQDEYCNSCSRAITKAIKKKFDGICGGCNVEKEKNKKWLVLHLFSPLIFTLILYVLLGDHLSLGEMLAMGIFFSMVLFFGLVTSKTKEVKTGKSFQTKSGFKMDEYEEQITPGLKVKNNHYLVFFVHLVILAISIYVTYKG